MPSQEYDRLYPIVWCTSRFFQFNRGIFIWVRFFLFFCCYFTFFNKIDCNIFLSFQSYLDIQDLFMRHIFSNKEKQIVWYNMFLSSILRWSFCEDYSLIYFKQIKKGNRGISLFSSHNSSNQNQIRETN